MQQAADYMTCTCRSGRCQHIAFRSISRDLASAHSMGRRDPSPCSRVQWEAPGNGWGPEDAGQQAAGARAAVRRHGGRSGAQRRHSQAQRQPGDPVCCALPDDLLRHSPHSSCKPYSNLSHATSLKACHHAKAEEQTNMTGASLYIPQSPCNNMQHRPHDTWMQARPLPTYNEVACAWKLLIGREKGMPSSPGDGNRQGGMVT